MKQYYVVSIYMGITSYHRDDATHITTTLMISKTSQIKITNKHGIALRTLR
jgi:hypothetical protein